MNGYFLRMNPLNDCVNQHLSIILGVYYLFTTMKKFVLLICCLAVISFLSSCQEDEPSLPLVLTITPSGSNAIPPGKTLLFTANADVSWEVPDETGGTITDGGVYVAPNKIGTFTILATSKEDPTIRATSRVYVTQSHEMFSKIKRGGYVMHFRHAEANVGQDKLTTHGQWWKTCRSDSARQISEQGLEDVKKIGQVLRGLNVPIDSALTSEFCRCKMSADTMGLDIPTTKVRSLTYFAYGETYRHERLHKLINEQKVGVNHNMMFVSHSYAQGSTYPPINQGDMDIFLPNGNGGEPTYVGRISLGAFLELYRD